MRGPGAYEGDVQLVSGGAAALTFRANADATEHYTANVDTAGFVKLWRPGHAGTAEFRDVLVDAGTCTRTHLGGWAMVVAGA